MSALTTYAPLAGSRFASTEQAQYFIMNALLYSRMEAGYPSNREFFDEDVNVYLANLLVSRIEPPPGAVPDGVARADAALFEDAAARGDRARYELYRGCADALLVSLGIFRNARGRRPSSASRIAPPARTYIGRGKTYYAIASSLAATLARRGNAVADVNRLLKEFDLTDRFELVVTSLDVKRPKPFPDPLLKILSHFGAAPHQAVFVGDSEVDEATARAAGAWFVGYRNPGLNAARHIGSLAELKPLLAPAIRMET